MPVTVSEMTERRPRDHEERKRLFAELLRGVMKEQNVSIRELGRRIDPKNRATGTRNVFRYLATDTYPIESIRRALETALGVTEGTLEIEEAAPSGDTFRDGDGDGAADGADGAPHGEGGGARRGARAADAASAGSADVRSVE